MAIATTTTLAKAINTIYDGLVKTFYTGTPFLNLLGFAKSVGPGSIGAPGHLAGNSYDWIVKYGATAASLYNEGDAAASPGNATYNSATLAPISCQRVVQITGHAMDSMKANIFDGVKEEFNEGFAALLHLAEEQFCAAIIDAIDDDTSYGGITRATYHLDSKVVAGSSAALTRAELSEMYEALQLDPRGVVFSNPREWGIISAPEQATAYTEIATGLHKVGDDESTGTNLPYNSNQTDKVLDAGLLKHTLEYNGIPWYSVPTMTNTYVFLLKFSNIIIREVRPVSIKQLGAVDDSDTFQLTWRGIFGYKDPYRAGRIEALTT